MKHNNLIKKSMLLLAIFVTFFSYGQVPHVSGIINVSVKTGTIEAELTISNINNLDEYSIRLNKGLNIQYFRNITDSFNYTYKVTYEPEKADEALEYLLPNDENKKQPQAFNIKYVGKFPVISDTIRADDYSDWKGNIAFNGKTIRATEQSAWYPILYYKQKDLALSQVTYDLTIISNDSKSIYLNGSLPISGKKATFKSSNPLPLLLFAGNYTSTKSENISILNGNLNKARIKTLNDITEQISGYYEQKLKIAYGSKITFLNTSPVSKQNAFLFVTYPTVAIVGNAKWNLNNFFDEKTNKLVGSYYFTFLAHEFGHYYFGTYFNPTGDLRWMFIESLADYLSIQATKDILGQESYNSIVKKYIDEIKNFNPTPLNKVNSANDLDNTYRYKYLPLMLIALEKQIGTEKMWTWLNVVLQKRNAVTDYSFFKSTLLESGVTEEALLNFETRYITNNNAKAEIVDLLK